MTEIEDLVQQSLADQVHMPTSIGPASRATAGGGRGRRGPSPQGARWLPGTVLLRGSHRHHQYLGGRAGCATTPATASRGPSVSPSPAPTIAGLKKIGGVDLLPAGRPAPAVSADGSARGRPQP